MARRRSVAGTARGEEKKKGVLSDFSLTTVIASSLAAVTSLVFSSRIGLAGTLIGTAVAAAASSIATQVYKGMLTASADRIKEMVPTQGDGGPIGSQGEDGGATTSFDEAARTTPYAVSGMPETLSDKTSPHMMMAETGTPVAPASIRAAAAEREAQALKRRLMVFAGAVAILVALASAGLIALVTHGYGIGPFAAGDEADEYVAQEAVPQDGAWQEGQAAVIQEDATASAGDVAVDQPTSADSAQSADASTSSAPAQSADASSSSDPALPDSAQGATGSQTQATPSSSAETAGGATTSDSAATGAQDAPADAPAESQGATFQG